MSWKIRSQQQALLEREIGAVHKDWGGRLVVALAFPNTYYVGMSSLALQALYRGFNAFPDVACERVFWDKGGYEARRPLLTLESGRRVAEVDVWAFTISYEMDFFNVVEMLRQAGAPPLARDRDEAWPLLIAGGPGVTMNPEPMAPIFDAIVIGEGEAVLADLVDLFRRAIDAPRAELLAELDRMPGVYVPARVPPIAEQGDHPCKIERLWVRDQSQFPPISSLYTPETEFRGMHLMEIARGCGRGCRFCLAGYVYRPPRELPMDLLLDWAREGLKHTDRIGLISAAVSDHSQIDELAPALVEMGAKLSASSMRVDPISRPLVEALRASGAQTLTIAPEAGSARLRDVIAKTQTEAQLLDAVALAAELDFPQIKFYFMIGHPTETQEDLEELVAFALKARDIFKRRIAMNATPFVPKAHTPFQWMAMTDARTLKKRQSFITRRLGKHRIAVRADSPAWAEVQAVLARGDRRLAQVILDIPRLSVRDFWETMARHGLDRDAYLGQLPLDQPMPWEIVASGVKPAFFRQEWRRAQQARLGPHCPPDSAGCLACGVCDPAWAFRFQPDKLRKKPDFDH
ncbi:MAG TPA: radical SAM protein [Anaerolineae bacterium]|nr:radical SAM protein [Caldilineae bacterium]HID33679.1 radical SAM protein [Anaerolineae bacterium]HIQ12701.1 radical SAM protein [Caldilineales bacterium]